MAMDDEHPRGASGEGEERVESEDSLGESTESDDLTFTRDLAVGKQVRFQPQGFTAKGGMGRIGGVHDQLLDRPLVRKRPHRSLRTAGNWRAFVHEAQVTAQLNHPAIVPVFDLGHDRAGFFYLMPRVEGTTLHEVLIKIASEDEKTVARFSMKRLLNVFRTVCGAVAHAHERGIVHRDIKPDQILLGEHDEVLLTDWGLAARLGKVREDYGYSPSVGASAGAIRSGQTVLDGFHGAPRYQPPERLETGRIPAHTTQDVYSLGAVLYHVLTLRAPVDPPQEPGMLATAPAYLVFIKQQISKLEPPSRRAWHRPLDTVWDDICLRCLASAPEDRYQDAGELYVAVEAALSEQDERRRNRERAARALAEGARAVRRLDAVAEELYAAEVALKSLTASVAPYQRARRREELWAVEDEQRRLAGEHAELMAEAERAYEVALTIDADSHAARSSLADLYLDRLQEAEARGDGPGAAYFLLRMARYDDGTRASLLRRLAVVHVASTPAPERVRVSPLVETARRLCAGAWQEAGDRGGDRLHLQPGRHAVEVSAPGCLPARYTLDLQAGEEFFLEPKLPRPARVPAGFIYVPAGPGWLEGDPLSVGNGPRRRRRFGDFAMGVFPVTMAEYLDFLTAVGEEEARLRVPRDPVDDIPLFSLDKGVWSIPATDAHGDSMERAMPVLLVRAADAEAYAAWLSRLRDRTFRLPTRDEWEYAARGGDGRIFPWGDYPEPTFCWGREPQRGRAVPAAVGRCPEDCSPFGVRDLAGGVGDWLADDFVDGGAQRHVGGGSWFASHGYQRLPRRFGLDPAHRSAGMGFRLLLEL